MLIMPDQLGPIDGDTRFVELSFSAEEQKGIGHQHLKILTVLIANDMQLQNHICLMYFTPIERLTGWTVDKSSLASLQLMTRKIS